jgi:LysM repeat protein
MTLKKLLVFIFVFLLLQVKSQDRLLIAGYDENYYVVHSVEEKESLSSIGRIYGYTAKQLAQYNSLSPNAGLQIGAKLKIPLTADNFGIQAEMTTGIALYHIAQKGDNLFKLSQKYYKVPLASLRTWNDLTSDIVKDGQAIIVGFFDISKTNINVSQDNSSNSVTTSLNTSKPVPAQKAPLKNPNVMDAAVDGTRTLQGEMKPLTDKELLLLGAAQASVKQPVNNLPPATVTDANEYILEDLGLNYTPKDGDEGYFALFYDETSKSGEMVSKSGDVGVFKSTSGVLDHKYYVLKNNVLPGSIIKITVPTKRTIYARVLGPIPENSNSGNMLLYMSNAAASALGMTQSSFFASIKYHK